MVSFFDAQFHSAPGGLPTGALYLAEAVAGGFAISPEMSQLSKRAVERVAHPAATAQWLSRFSASVSLEVQCSTLACWMLHQHGKEGARCDVAMQELCSLC